MSKRHVTIATTAALGVVAASAVAIASRPEPDAAAVRHHPAAPAPANVPAGEVSVATAVALDDRVNALNHRLDACLLAHGATRVPFEQRGWRYVDAGGAAAQRCVEVSQRIARLVAGGAYRAAVTSPAYIRFSTCMQPTYRDMAPAARYGPDQRQAIARCARVAAEPTG